MHSEYLPDFSGSAHLGSIGAGFRSKPYENHLIQSQLSHYPFVSRSMRGDKAHAGYSTVTDLARFRG